MVEMNGKDSFTSLVSPLPDFICSLFPDSHYGCTLFTALCQKERSGKPKLAYLNLCWATLSAQPTRPAKQLLMI